MIKRLLIMTVLALAIAGCGADGAPKAPMATSSN